MCGGFWSNPVQSVSDTVSHVGTAVVDAVSDAASNPTLQAIVAPGAAIQNSNFAKDTYSHAGKVVSGSPLAKAVITVGGAIVGVPPSITAVALAANDIGQGKSAEEAAKTGLLSYAGGSGAANYMNTGSVFGSTAGAAGTYVPGVGAGQAGYTLTGDAIADAAILKDMGYGGSAIESMLSSGGGLLSTIGNSVGTGLGNIGNNVLNRLTGGGSGTGTGTGSSGSGGGLDYASLIATGANLAGGYLNNQAAADAATKQADAQIRAAQIAADAAKFRPVGVKTNFGESKFGFDANGNLNSAGYTLDPRLQAQQNQLMGASGGMLDQFTGSQAATAPMGTAAQRMMSLGNQYLQTDPQAQAAMYMQQQQGLLAPGRASTMADLQAQMQAQGRGGFAIGGGVGGQGAANPQMQALYNAQLQQDALLASQATQGGMDYAKFGGAFVGAGGQMMRDMYGTQTAAYNPYQTALGGAQQIEGLGQNALTQGISLGNTATAANAQAGQLLGNGMTNAANTIGNQAAQAGSLWGNILQGGATRFDNYQGQQAQQQQQALNNQYMQAQMAQWGK